jgi:hypothetical protein
MLKNCMYLMLAVIGLVVLYSIFSTENFGGDIKMTQKMQEAKTMASPTTTMTQAKTMASPTTTMPQTMTQTNQSKAVVYNDSGPKTNKKMVDLGKTVLDQTDNLFRSLIDMSVNSSNAQISLLNSISAPRDQKPALRDQAMEFNKKLQKSANSAKKSLDFYKMMANQGMNSL